MTRLRRGTTFLNRYVLGQPVGRGRVSVIYEADDTVNSRRVAVRLLAPQFASDPHARDRVRHPAMIMTMLRDAGVPRVYEFGDAPLGDGSTIAYSVSEFLTGESLDSRLARGPLPWPEAVGVAATVADVLTVAHAQGIVLGALTPASILLTADGPKVVDLDAAGGMAPVTVAEPVRSRRARGRNRTDVAPPGPAGPTPAEDIRALGAVLREMVPGPGFADLPPTLPALWQACLGRDDEQPDAPSLSLELWGLLTPQLAATGSRSPNAPRAAVESRAGAEERTAAERAAAETAARARGTLARAALDRKPRPAGPGHPPAGYAPAQSVPDEYPPDRYTVDEYPADGYGHEAAQAIALDYPGHGGRHRRRRPARADPGQAPAATGRG